MSSQTCFVVQCKNVVGVPFPEDQSEREKWLQNLNIRNTVVKEKDFVCTDHFNPSDLLEVHIPGTGEMKKIVKDGAIPQNKEILEDDSTANVINEIEEILAEDCEPAKSTLCRLCLFDEDVIIDVTDKLVEDDDITVIKAINDYLYPIKVGTNDKQSQKICLCCRSSLRSFHSFRSLCLHIYKKFKRKRKSDETCDLTIIKKNKPTSSMSNTESVMQKLTIAELKAKVQKEDEIESKFKKVESDLRRVLEGQLGYDQCADNIIIAVTNDDDQVEEVVVEKTPKRSSKSKSFRKKLISSNEISSSSESHAVVLPKCIKITEPQDYSSKVGTFPVNIRVYMTEFELFELDGYLFELRLDKGDKKYLQCVIGSCPSTAIQISNTSPEEKQLATVKIAHNHTVVAGIDRKKQIFYYIMRKKILADKSMDIRAIYNWICSKDPEIKDIISIRNVVSEMYQQQINYSFPKISTFDELFHIIEDSCCQKLHFTHDCKQFYQERFQADDGSKAVVFANRSRISDISTSNLMYVDASFKIETAEKISFQLVTVLVWAEDSYYPILFALINKKTQDIFKKIFNYLYANLAPFLRPEEIVTEYEANLYYALGETYIDSHIGGSVFYYTQNMYKKVCALKLSPDLETNSYFRNIYHMILMLPLLPVNTILDGLHNIEVQAEELSLAKLAQPLFEYVKTVWIESVTPDLFCVHRLDNRINENVIAPFKKLRDYLTVSKGKCIGNALSIFQVIEKISELDSFLQRALSTANKKSFGRDISSQQKKNVLAAWQYIENHPKININNFFLKVSGYIKSMENQLWIWGFYGCVDDLDEELINASNFQIVTQELVIDPLQVEEEVQVVEDVIIEELHEDGIAQKEGTTDEIEVMEALINDNGDVVLKQSEEVQVVEDVIIEELHEDGIAQKEGTTDEIEVMEALINDNGDVVLKQSEEEKFINYLYNVT